MKSVSLNHEAVVALCTPRGSGALSMIRISGPGAVEIADTCALLTSKKKLVDAVSHTIHHGFVMDGHVKVDEVLFMLMRAPRTFTGYDTVEITGHNNNLLIDRTIQSLVKAGARIAQRGEFTRQAVINGKIDLVQAESIAELIAAQSEAAVEKALGQVEGSLSAQFAQLQNDLEFLVVLSEVSFEFLEEEQVDFGHGQRILDQIELVYSKIKKLHHGFAGQQHVREGVRIVLVGTVNVGKSTLFNAVIGKKRAIVSPQAGTTRDTIEAGLSVNGILWTVVDTAGLRKTDEVIEQEGILRTHEEAAKADVVVLVFDASRVMSDQERERYQEISAQYGDKIIVVASKCEGVIKAQDDIFESVHKVSALQERGIEELISLIESKITHCTQVGATPYLLNERHRATIETLIRKIHDIQNLTQQGGQYELVAYTAKDMLIQLSQLAGKHVSEKTLDLVFQKFCVGK